jgi:hypothetical protein
MSEIVAHEGLFVATDREGLLEWTRRGYHFVREIVGPTEVIFLLAKLGETVALDDAVARCADLEAAFQTVTTECQDLRRQIERIQREVEREIKRRNEDVAKGKRLMAVFAEMREALGATRYEDIMRRARAAESEASRTSPAGAAAPGESVPWASPPKEGGDA